MERKLVPVIAATVAAVLAAGRAYMLVDALGEVDVRTAEQVPDPQRLYDHYVQILGERGVGVFPMSHLPTIGVDHSNDGKEALMIFHHALFSGDWDVLDGGNAGAVHEIAPAQLVAVDIRREDGDVETVLAAGALFDNGQFTEYRMLVLRDQISRYARGFHTTEIVTTYGPKEAVLFTMPVPIGYEAHLTTDGVLIIGKEGSNVIIESNAIFSGGSRRRVRLGQKEWADIAGQLTGNGGTSVHLTPEFVGCRAGLCFLRDGTVPKVLRLKDHVGNMSSPTLMLIKPDTSVDIVYLPRVISTYKGTGIGILTLQDIVLVGTTKSDTGNRLKMHLIVISDSGEYFVIPAHVRENEAGQHVLDLGTVLPYQSPRKISPQPPYGSTKRIK